MYIQDSPRGTLAAAGWPSLLYSAFPVLVFLKAVLAFCSVEEMRDERDLMRQSCTSEVGRV